MARGGASVRPRPLHSSVDVPRRSQRVTRSQSNGHDVPERALRRPTSSRHQRNVSSSSNASEAAQRQEVVTRTKRKNGAAVPATLDEVSDETDNDKADAQNGHVRPSPGRLSGTTARTSLNANATELADLNSSQQMIESLPELYEVSAKILNVLAPQQPSTDNLAAIHSRLRDQKSLEARKLNRHKNQFQESQEHFGDAEYINVPLSLMGILKPLGLKGLGKIKTGPLRPDDLLYTANLASLALDIEGGRREPERMPLNLQLLGSVFPKPFLSSISATGNTFAPGQSTLLGRTLDIALELRTHFFISVVEENDEEEDFDASAALRDIFFEGANGITFKGWDCEGLSNTKKQPIKDAITKRVEEISSILPSSEDSQNVSDTVIALQRAFTVESLLVQIMAWVRARADEIARQVQEKGNVDAMQINLDRELRRRLDPTSRLSEGVHDDGQSETAPQTSAVTPVNAPADFALRQGQGPQTLTDPSVLRKVKRKSMERASSVVTNSENLNNKFMIKKLKARSSGKTSTAPTAPLSSAPTPTANSVDQNGDESVDVLLASNRHSSAPLRNEEENDASANTTALANDTSTSPAPRLEDGNEPQPSAPAAGFRVPPMPRKSRASMPARLPVGQSRGFDPHPSGHGVVLGTANKMDEQAKPTKLRSLLDPQPNAHKVAFDDSQPSLSSRPPTQQPRSSGRKGVPPSAQPPRSGKTLAPLYSDEVEAGDGAEEEARAEEEGDESEDMYQVDTRQDHQKPALSSKKRPRPAPTAKAQPLKTKRARVAGSSERTNEESSYRSNQSDEASFDEDEVDRKQDNRRRHEPLHTAPDAGNRASYEGPDSAEEDIAEKVALAIRSKTTRPFLHIAPPKNGRKQSRGWSKDEDKVIINGVAKYQGQFPFWRRIKDEDDNEDPENGPLGPKILTNRDNVNLKDRAIQIKLLTLKRGQVPPAGFEYVRLRAHEKAKLDGSGIDWRALCGEEEQRQEEEEQDDDAGS